MSITPAKRLLNLIHQPAYVSPMCEALGGFRNDVWTEVVFRSGEQRLTDGGPDHYIDLSLIRNIHFDLDYINVVLVQVWNYRAESPTWEYVLLLNHAANEWVPECIWYFGSDMPSYGLVGRVLDAHLAHPGGGA